jgi:histidyl-tRNA synthetase
MDLIGEPGPLADAEVIAAAIDIMRASGFGPADVQARVSDRGVVRTLLLGRGLTEAQLPAAFEVIDKSERVPGEALAEILGKVGIGKREASMVFEVAKLRSIETVTAALAKVKGGEEAGASLRTAIDALGTMGLGAFVCVDLSIIRGLAYYTGIVFELFDARKSLRAICGGGRYDDLLQEVAGIDLPCVGFGMGDVVLGELLKERGALPEAPASVDVFLVAVGGDDLPHVLKLAHELRDRGMAVEYGLRDAPIRKQLELAAARGAPRAVIVGPDERAAGVVVVRDLRAGTEEKVPVAKLLDGLFR